MLNLTFAFIVAFCCIHSHGADVDPQEAFKRAGKLMQEEKFEDALPYLLQVQKEYPDELSVLWNLGLTFARLNKHDEALATWKRYQSLSPQEFPVHAKIVQAYQGLGRTKDRDDAVHKVYEFRASMPLQEKVKLERFCREQTLINGKQVFAFEFFDSKPPRNLFYRFSVLKPDGNEEFYFSLGSSEDTTKIAQEVGDIKASDRLFHLDEYRPGKHTTFGFYKAKPSYDAVRAEVVAALEGKLKPLSSSETPVK